MNKLREYIKNKPHLAMSIPAFLCFLQFVSTVWDMIRDKKFEYNSIIQLLSSLDGFETMILCIIMIALKDKTK